MKRSASVLGFLILVAACATSSPSQKKMVVAHADDVADDPGKKVDPNTVICETVQLVGSHIPQQLCIRYQDKIEIQQRLQNQLDSQLYNQNKKGQ